MPKADRLHLLDRQQNASHASRMTGKLMSHFSDVMSKDIDENNKVTHEQLGERIEQKLEDNKFWKKMEGGVSAILYRLLCGGEAVADAPLHHSSRLASAIGAILPSSSLAARTISSPRLRRTTNDSGPASSSALSGSATRVTAPTSAGRS